MNVILASASDSSPLLSNQDTNYFLVYVESEIFYTIIKNFTN